MKEPQRLQLSDSRITARPSLSGGAHEPSSKARQAVCTHAEG